MKQSCGRTQNCDARHGFALHATSWRMVEDAEPEEAGAGVGVGAGAGAGRGVGPAKGKRQGAVAVQPAPETWNCEVCLSIGPAEVYGIAQASIDELVASTQQPGQSTRPPSMPAPYCLARQA